MYISIFTCRYFQKKIFMIYYQVSISHTMYVILLCLATVVTDFENHVEHRNFGCAIVANSILHTALRSDLMRFSHKLIIIE